MSALPGTPSTPLTKRELIRLLNANTTYWETMRERKSRWYGIAKSSPNSKPVRTFSTNERQVMENLCGRLKIL